MDEWLKTFMTERLDRLETNLTKRMDAIELNSQGRLNNHGNRLGVVEQRVAALGVWNKIVAAVTTTALGAAVVGLFKGNGGPSS